MNRWAEVVTEKAKLLKQELATPAAVGQVTCLIGALSGASYPNSIATTKPKRQSVLYNLPHLRSTVH